MTTIRFTESQIVKALKKFEECKKFPHYLMLKLTLIRDA